MRDYVLIIHFIGLAMGLGTSFGFMFLGIAGSKMQNEDRLKFQLNTLSLSRMGQIGLVLLLGSGLALMTPYWDTLARSPLLIAKLLLFLLLGALIGIISSLGKKASKGDAELMFKKIEHLGKISLLTALVIVALAVLNFH